MAALPAAPPARFFSGISHRRRDMPQDDENPRRLNSILDPNFILDVARREGVQFDDPQQTREFALRFLSHIDAQCAARAQPDPDGLNPWQREAAAKFTTEFLLLAKAILPRPPRSALLITLFGDGKEVGAFDVGGMVQVEVTLKGGESRIVRPAEIVEANARMPEVERVETVGPSLAYVLWVGRWPTEHTLFAWDLRGPLLRCSDDQIDNLLARLRGVGKSHPQESPGWFARLDREVPLTQMLREERRAVMRQALEDELIDPKSRKVPLRGIIQVGGRAIWDAGGSESPYGLLQKLSTLCRGATEEMERQNREIPLNEDRVATSSATEHAEMLVRDRAEGLALTEGETVQLDNGSDDYETLIRDYCGGLPAKEREAVQHYLRARLIHGLDFDTYCTERALPYGTIRRAASRGLRRIREK
jgi:hypothetical protein